MVKPEEPQGGFVQDVEGRVFADLWQRRKDASGYMDELPDMTQNLSDYAHNLNTIVDLAQAKSVRLIFMTQPSLYKEKMTPEEDALIWGGALENTGKTESMPDQANTYYTTGATARGMKKYNHTLLQVCQVRHVECVDLASALPQDTTIFYSDVHYHENGSKQVANVLAQYLLNHPPFEK
jgi:hypothetical protein